MHILVPGQPAVTFGFVGVQIVQNDVDFSAFVVLDDTVHEVEEFDASAAFILAARD